MNLGCIKPLCDLLTVMDSKIVQVALNGLENILRLGEQEAKQENNGTGVNPYCSLIEEAYGTADNMTLYCAYNVAAYFSITPKYNVACCARSGQDRVPPEP